MNGRHNAFAAFSVLIFLTLLSVSTPDIIELAHDQGRPAGSIFLTGGYGHAVSFSPPGIPWYIQKVRIYGLRSGNRTESMEFVVEIWGSNRSVLHSSPHSYAKFKTLSTWVDIDIAGVMVADSFIIVVYTGSTSERGIGIAYDSGLENKHSEIVIGKRILADWSEVKWKGTPPRKERINWMVRVVGSTPTTTTTASVTTSEPSSTLFGLDKTQLLQVAGGGAAAAIVPFMGWMFKTRKRRFASSYLTKIDSIYNEFSMNREECRKRLIQMKGEIVQFLKKGKIDEPHFTIIDTKLERYLKDLA